MLRHLGARSTLTSDVDDVVAADRLILPGVGHFDHCATRLRETGLAEAVTVAVQDRAVPLLGICVGAQLLGTGSEEGSAAGLGWFRMTARRLSGADQLRIPRMGWGEVAPIGNDPLFTAQDTAPERFYFAHSYYLDCEDPAIAAATT